MSELLEATKSVIDWFDEVTPSDMPIEKLRAAVERAESQKAVGFDEWFPTSGWNPECVEYILEVWQAAQQTERERIKGIIREVTSGFGNCDRLMEKIDAAL